LIRGREGCIKTVGETHNYTPYLFPLTTLFLLFAVAALAYCAKNRRGYKPLVLGILGATVVLVGKFVMAYDSAMYGGIALLVGASMWNSWPRRKMDDQSCPVCVS
jgi:hypothetical protein